MSEPFIGEIEMIGFNFAPRGWAFCDGQLLAVSQNDALFSLLGTIYGGDGRTTFGLPDLRGRVPIHAGTGPGLSPRPLGQKSGAETVALSTPQMASHTHAAALHVSPNEGESVSPGGRYPAATESPTRPYASTGDQTPMNQGAVVAANTGGGQSHQNVQPFTAIHFVIALMGIYPSRS